MEGGTKNMDGEASLDEISGGESREEGQIARMELRSQTCWR